MNFLFLKAVILIESVFFKSITTFSKVLFNDEIVSFKNQKCIEISIDIDCKIKNPQFIYGILIEAQHRYLVHNIRISVARYDEKSKFKPTSNVLKQIIEQYSDHLKFNKNNSLISIYFKIDDRIPLDSMNNNIHVEALNKIHPSVIVIIYNEFTLYHIISRRLLYEISLLLGLTPYPTYSATCKCLSTYGCMLDDINWNMHNFQYYYMDKCSFKKLIQMNLKSIEQCLSSNLKPRCGDGFVDPSETCDCGDNISCLMNGGNICCNNCQLNPGCKCSHGPCCKKGLILKEVACSIPDNECELNGFCDGVSPQCPINYKPLYSRCHEGYGYCNIGRCILPNDLCDLLHPNEQITSTDHFNCYERSLVVINNTCSTMENSSILYRTTCSNICSKLFCSTLSSEDYIEFTTDKKIKCKIVNVQNDDYFNFGDGLKCAPNSICYKNQCVAIESIAQSFKNRCPSYSLLNHLDQCVPISPEYFKLVQQEDNTEQEKIHIPTTRIRYNEIDINKFMKKWKTCTSNEIPPTRIFSPPKKKIEVTPKMNNTHTPAIDQEQFALDHVVLSTNDKIYFSVGSATIFISLFLSITVILYLKRKYASLKNSTRNKAAPTHNSKHDSQLKIMKSRDYPRDY